LGVKIFGSLKQAPSTAKCHIPAAVAGGIVANKTEPRPARAIKVFWHAIIYLMVAA